MDKLLTISIAAYNVESFLEQCLDSLLIPSMEKLEVLIENDGSKDGTAAIAKQYEEKYPGVFRLINKQNGGYGSTINQSIRLATGSYFKQLDGDDWYHTEHLEELICALENVDADCIYTPFLEVYEADSSEKLRAEAVSEVGVYPLNAVISPNWFLQMHALAFRTELLRQHNVTILEHCFYTDQEYVIYPLLYVESVFMWDRHIYCYRMGREGQSVSLDGWKKHCTDHDRVVRQMLSHYDQIQLCHDNVKAKIMARVMGLLRWQYDLYMVLGDKQKELKEFDAYIQKNHPEVFAARQEVEGKRLKLMRLTGFGLYPILRKKELED